jgi:MscS family membrane protein
MQKLNEILAYLNNAIEYLHIEPWIVHVFIVIFLTLFCSYLVKRFLKKTYAHFSKSRVSWDDALIDAVQPPLSLLIWVLGLAFAARIVQGQSDAAIFSLIKPLQDIGVIIAITWFLVRFIQRMQENFIRKEQLQDPDYDRTTADAIGKLLIISVAITAFLVILQTLGYSISGVLAFGGIGGIAVGFAARDLLANFFGGFMIYMDRPFVVGDWIRSPDREIEGTVEKIGWRLTQIRTFDKRPLYLPNSIFNTISVENPSRMTNRRIKETVGIRYADAGKMRAIVADVKKMLEGHDEIDKDRTMIVNFDTFASSSLDFFIYTFTRTTDWIKYHEIKQDVLLKIIDIIEAHGAECAFPTSTIHIPDGVPITEK